MAPKLFYKVSNAVRKKKQVQQREFEKQVKNRN